ncbi:MAG: VOC family protein [Candidatus Kapabacteria bacterium]|nr:VOC family protein [Candidatus Kapabacteria bacterium]
MLQTVHPKLPMRSKSATRDFYVDCLGFREIGSESFDEYLMVKKDNVEIHFFAFKDLLPTENYGQIYIRTEAIDKVYQGFTGNKVEIHPNGDMQIKPWGQKEFSILDPDNNLLTFGQSL